MGEPSCKNVLPYIKPGWVGVEIGVQWGVSALAFLEHGVRFMYLVDPWENYDGYSSAFGPKWDRIQEEKYRECLSRLAKYDDGRHFAVLRMKSRDAAPFIPMVDFVWIDGNHDYQYVREDINLYYAKVKVGGGILCGHDYVDNGACDVAKAVHEFAPNEVIPVSPCWVIKR